MAKPKKKVTSQERNEFIWGWVFIIPTMLGLIILNIIPIFQTIYQSFFKTGDFGRGKNEREKRIPYHYVPAYGRSSGGSRHGVEMVV